MTLKSTRRRSKRASPSDRQKLPGGETEGRYRALVENMLNGLAYCQMLFEGNRPQDFIYLAVNPAFQALTGLENVVGRRATEVIPGIRDTDPELFEIYGRVARTGRPERSEYWFRPLDLWLDISVHSTQEGYFVAVFDNVTQRKRAEEALRKSEAHYRALVESAADGIFIADAQGRYVDVNQQGCRLLGYAREELLALSIPDVVATEEAVRVAPEIQALKAGEVLRSEWQFLRKDGTLLLGEVSGTILPDGQLLGILRDITERKETEERLRAREAEFKEAQRIAGIGSWEWSTSTGAVAWSEGLNRLLARDADLLPPTFEELPRFYAPESWERLKVVIARAVELGVPYDLDLEMIRADGTTCSTTTRGEAARGPDGAVEKLRGTVLDISDRKRAESRLRLQSAALDAASHSMVLTDRNGTIEWVNPAFTSATGYTTEEVIGQNPRLLKSGVHDRTLYKNLWDTILAGESWHGELTNRRKDGGLVVEDVTITPVKNAGGEVTNFIAIKQDLTKAKQLEARFLQAQKMESVGQLAGGIAHDFNNLLTVINGTAELVLASLKTGDPLCTDLNEIARAGARAAGLTRQLLAFSRKQILQPRVVNLNTVVVDLESMLRRLIGEDVDLVVVPTLGPATVRADPGQLEQVIANLAVNARDAMPKGGRLTIETRDMAIDGQYADQHGVAVEPGPYVMLSVSDTGTGIDEVTRGRIFEPFFTTKGPGKGTGLGLSTVYGIVKQSGGFVRVYSEVGQGTTFKIYLPRATDEAERERRGPAIAPAHGTETILLVEDVEGVRHLVKRMLESAGYTVLTAADGNEALLVLERHEAPVALIITDIVMPGMSGPTLAKEYERIRPGTRVLYMSGYTDDVVVRHGALQEGMHFLGKPFTAAEVIRKVREVIDSRG